MKNFLMLSFAMLILSSCYAQGDRHPAYLRELQFKENIAYLNGYPFTGLIVDETTYEQVGQFYKGLKNGLFVEYYESKRKKKEGYFIHGVKNGLHTEWFENGNKSHEINYLNGKLNGSYSEWYPNGNKKLTGNYLNENKEGLFTLYYENEKKEKLASYKDGQKNGKYSEWHKNGTLRKEILYSEDKITNDIIMEYDDRGKEIIRLETKSGDICSVYIYNDSLYIGYYDYFSDHKKEEGKLLNGKKHGSWIEWYLNGQKSFEGSYRNGLRDGKGIDYNERGGIVWDGVYKDGDIHGKGILRNDFKTYYGEWNMGKKNGVFLETYSNNTKEKGQYLNDIRDGLWTEWFPNGQKKEEKSYLNEQIDGKHSRWFDNGKLEFSLVYFNGKIADGQYFFFNNKSIKIKEENYIGGKIIKEYAYTGHVKNGPFVEYYKDGSKKLEGRYEFGKRKVSQRYGANLRGHTVITSMGKLILIVGLVLLAAGSA